MSAKEPPSKPPHPSTRVDNVARDEGAAAPPEGPVSEADFDSLVSDILENPEILLKSELTAEQVLEIQKRLNPYAGIAGPAPSPDHKKVAACSYTNLREEYLRRLTMTSLVGFLFQIFHEWEVPVEQRRWIPASQKKKTDDPATAPFDLGKLVERLEATLAIAKEAQSTAEQAAALKQKALEDDLVLPAHAPKEARSRVAEQTRASEAAAAKAAGLLYAATHATHRAGLEAGARLRSTAEAGMKYPEVKAVLSQYPLPAPPGQIEMPAAAAKEIIGGFLRHWLVFDPSVHVRSGHDAKTIEAAIASLRVGAADVPVDTKDPSHLTLEAVRAAAPEPAAEHRDAVETIMSSKAYYNAVAALLRDEDLVIAALTAVESPEVFRHYLFPVPAASPARPAAENIPPQDTFHRWGYYTEVNYEELRTITEALYPERPDLDWAIALWAVFEGTPKEVDEAFDKHCQRYQEEVPSSIKALEFGAWSLLADFKENRKKIQFYNKHTEVLKRILDRHTDDRRIGAELMRNRVRQVKAENIAKDGPDAPGLKEYRRNLAEKGLDLGGKGVERVISPEEMKRLEKARGNIKAAQELELLEQTEKRIAELKELEKLRKAAGQDLTAEERRDLDFALKEIDKIREMVAVPDDAIQVDVFTSNPASGAFEKTHFYTKALAPEHIAAARAEFEAMRSGGNSEHPAVQATQPAPPPLQQPQQQADTGVPAFAPYAVEHILSSEQRTPAQQREEAVRDANARDADARKGQ